MHRSFHIFTVVLLTVIVLLFSLQAYGISNTADLKDVGIDEKLGQPLPLDLTFNDQQGKRVKLSELFQDGKPVILTLVYYSCPRVCSFILDGVKDVVNELNSLNLGEDFRIVSLSFNPDDSYELAGKKAVTYYEGLADNHFPKGNWSFLTGDYDSIARLTKSVGFKYKKDGEEYAHPTAIMVLTPDGQVSRYLYGVQFRPKDLRLALIEASNGKIGSSEILNKVLLFCYEFDPVGKKYALQALNVVKAGGVATLLSLTILLAIFWKREKKQSKESREDKKT